MNVETENKIVKVPADTVFNLDEEPCKCVCGTEPIVKKHDTLFSVSCPNCHISISTSRLRSSVALWNDLHSGEFNAKT